MIRKSLKIKTTLIFFIACVLCFVIFEGINMIKLSINPYHYASQPLSTLSSQHIHLPSVEQTAELNARLGVMSVEDSKKLEAIAGEGYTDGSITNTDLNWIIQLINRDKNSAFTFPHYERIILAMGVLESVKNYTTYQKNKLMPVLIYYIDSSSDPVRNATLMALWSVKDLRAAPIVSEWIHKPISGIPVNERELLMNFVQHCKNKDGK